MSREDRAVGWLIRELLDKHNLSLREFEKRYGFPVGTVSRWKKGDNATVDDVPYSFIEALAILDGTSPADIFFQLGIDILEYFGKNLPQPPDFGVNCLVQNLRCKPKVLEAVVTALRARWYFCERGRLDLALSDYQVALFLASDAKELLLAAYIKQFIAEIYEMTNKLDEALALCDAIQETMLPVMAEATCQGNHQLATVATNIQARSIVRWLWVTDWARGVSISSVQDGLAILDAILEWKVYHALPSIYEFLARCVLDLGFFKEKAIGYIDQALSWTYALRHQPYIHYEMFLDTGANPPDEVLHYIWLEDRMLAVKTDILAWIDPWDTSNTARESYRLIKRPCCPSLQWSFHGRPFPVWQKLLNEASAMSDDTDNQLGISVDEWHDYLHKQQLLRIEALSTEAYGVMEVNETSDFLVARFRFMSMAEIAASCGAEHLKVKGTIYSSMFAALEGNTSLAKSRLDMIKDKSIEIHNPGVLALYVLGCRAVQHIEEGRDPSQFLE
jgi:transcriptional regulator with XRE-family HTH domain